VAVVDLPHTHAVFHDRSKKGSPYSITECRVPELIMSKKGSCLKKDIMQGTMPGARRRRRPRTAWMDNIKTWTGLSVEKSIRMTEDRDKWRKYVHGVVNPRIEDS